MIRKLDHLVITTADMGACLAFYEKLGFRSAPAQGRWELFAGDFKINVHLLGRELEPHAGQVCAGSADLCFQLDGGLEAFAEKLEQAGVPTLSGIVPRHGARGAMRSVYVRDPDGNLLEFCSYAPPRT
jgi:catechol 2,3-dioxygenase-like lactoylglutathione lyase family enzyme